MWGLGLGGWVLLQLKLVRIASIAHTELLMPFPHVGFEKEKPKGSLPLGKPSLLPDEKVKPIVGITLWQPLSLTIWAKRIPFLT